MADIINDGGVVGFTRQVTINAVVYTLDDLKWDVASGVEFTRTNHQSVPTGDVHVKGVPSGTGTLQLPDSTYDPDDLWGKTFVITEGTFKITQVGRAETKDGETKSPISFKKVIVSVVES